MILSLLVNSIAIAAFVFLICRQYSGRSLAVAALYLLFLFIPIAIFFGGLGWLLSGMTC